MKRRTHKNLLTNQKLSKSLLIISASVVALVGVYFLWRSYAFPASETNPQTTWATCNANANNSNPSTFTPLSDAAAAALVTHQPEIRPKNATGYTINGVHYAAANTYLPTSAEITSFRNAHDSNGHTPAQANPYYAYVDGLDGLSNPSTDDLIQWGAHKWGIPEDWLRAEYVQESQWSQYQLGDRATETAADYPQFPVQSRVSGSTTDIYESLGITQEKWRANGTAGVGTEPLRWKSTAFNIDYQLATLRFYYDNPQGTRTSWGDATYVPCQQWNSLGGWFEPYPWNSSGQQSYVSSVQSKLSSTAWTASSFINETLSFPSVVVFDTGSAPVPGDCNGDGHVNLTDLSVLLSHYAQAYTACDFNKDGIVNVFDLSVLLSNFGK